MILAGSLTISNPGFYTIQGLSLAARVANESETYLGSFGFGPSNLAGQSTEEFPVDLYLPVSAAGAGASLLVHSQCLRISLWGNATFGYLFPAGVTIQDNRSWGAPFSGLSIQVGNASLNGTVPVTVSFQNEASLIEAGTLRVAVVAASGITCGSASWVVECRAPGQQFSQTQPVPLDPGVLAGGRDARGRVHDSRVHGTPSPGGDPVSPPPSTPPTLQYRVPPLGWRILVASLRLIPMMLLFVGLPAAALSFLQSHSLPLPLSIVGRHDRGRGHHRALDRPLHREADPPLRAALGRGERFRAHLRVLHPEPVDLRVHGAGAVTSTCT